MNRLDPAGDMLRLTEHYRQMRDEELRALIRQSDELLPSARQVLASEIRSRGLDVEAKFVQRLLQPDTSYSLPAMVDQERFPALAPRVGYSDSWLEESEEEDPYKEDRELIEICKVWSLRDALSLQQTLDLAGIPFFMGPEKATGADQVQWDFREGVSVRIMRIGWRWAVEAMNRNYFPKDQPPEEVPPDMGARPMRCPLCHSTEIIFRRLVQAEDAPGNSSARKFCWMCGSCGNRWQDDGTMKEE